MKKDIDEAVKKALSAYGKESLLEMKAILERKGKGDSRLIHSIKYSVKKNAKGYELNIIMPDYAVFVDKGRKPGKQPPLEAIKKWTKRKGIPEMAAFPIARNIGKFGIKPLNFTVPLRSRLYLLEMEIDKMVNFEIERIFTEAEKSYKAKIN